MKILLCIALHLYTGPVDSKTQATELGQECKAVALEKARKAIQKCAKEGADKCEVIVSPDKSRVTIEHKVSTVGA